MTDTFRLVAPFGPRGDQEEAIALLADGIAAGAQRLVLVGVTGSGKTFTMANVIARLQRPALVLSPNKTLAAQLYAEFRGFFPDNAVEYFVSYYDYYQPEAYIPQSDTYIDKDAQINERIDRLRLSATTSLLTRRDVVVVSSISCIYGLGAPSEYRKMTVTLAVGESTPRNRLLRKLVDMQYSRGEDLARGTMRLRGGVLDIHSSYREDAYRIVFADEDDRIERIESISPVTGGVVAEYSRITIYPAKHFVQSDETLKEAVFNIQRELQGRYQELKSGGKLLEAERILQRTNYDLEMLAELGFCKGIENYSRHLTGRAAGQPPYTLLDYFPDDYITFIDESHVAVGQISAMYNGDRARKQTLVDFGFRLPSALDNRPLKDAEFFARVKPIVYVSATPGETERREAKVTAMQVVRPTGLLDPEVEVRPASRQVPDLLEELKLAVSRKERILVTTLTKKSAEELSDYVDNEGFSAEYLHSDVGTLERIDRLKSLRKGEVDILIGVNLLREGLDLPEVALVAILDADREGFLRSETSLIQMMGRAARNRTGRVILYADNITGSIRRAIDVTMSRRRKQLEYNEANGITPETIVKAIESLEVFALDPFEKELLDEEELGELTPDAKAMLVTALDDEMTDAVSRLDFERAAYLRDKLTALGAIRKKRKGRGR